MDDEIKKVFIYLSVGKGVIDTVALVFWYFFMPASKSSMVNL